MGCRGIRAQRWESVGVPASPSPRPPTHRHRCWKRSRMVSWLGAGSVCTRLRTRRLRWAWSCISGEGKRGLGQGNAWSYLRVWGSRPRPASCPPAPAPLTDGGDELAEVREGEEGLRQLSEEELQGAGDHVNVLPAPILQVQALICGEKSGAGGGGVSTLRAGRRAWGRTAGEPHRGPPCSAASGWWPGFR